MTSYGQLVLLILPVYALIGLGVLLRALGWMAPEADKSFLKTVINCLYPCLIFESVFRNQALKIPANLLYAPLMGFVIIVASFAISYAVARSVGLKKGEGLRTFAFASGINNYGYIPLLLMAGLFGADSLGLLLVHNVGCEAAIWTVGILILAGVSPREGWRHLFNGPVIALVLGLVVNVCGFDRYFPTPLLVVVHEAGACAVPLGLMLIGATLEGFLAQPRELFSPQISLPAVMLRLGVFPLMILALAKFMPFSVELKRVLLVQAAMPAGLMYIVIVKHYGGQSLTAVRVSAISMIVAVFTIPLWLRWGLAWLF
jgi:hypothetical protein